MAERIGDDSGEGPPAASADDLRPPAGMRGGPGPLLRVVKDRRLAFLVVGVANTAVGYLCFVLFHQLVGLPLTPGIGAPAASVVTLLCAHVVSVVVAFVLYRFLVFRVRGHVVRDFLRFESVYLVSIGINAAVLPLLVGPAGLDPLVAQALILLVTTLISYVGHRDFSFRRPGARP